MPEYSKTSGYLNGDNLRDNTMNNGQDTEPALPALFPASLGGRTLLIGSSETTREELIKD